MNEKYIVLFFAILVVSITLFFSQNNNKYPHWKVDDTKVYLAKISEKLDKVFDSVDQSSIESKIEEEIWSKASDAQCIIDGSLEQLRLLKSGSLIVGFWAKLLPSFFINSASVRFDQCNDEMVSGISLGKYFLKSDYDSLEAKLAKRTNSYEMIGNTCLINIESALDDITDYLIADHIIDSNKGQTPITIRSNIYDFKKRFNMNFTSELLAEIKRGNMVDHYAVQDFIRRRLGLKEPFMTAAFRSMVTRKSE